MYKYVLKRLFWTVVIVIAAAVVIFTVLYFTPGDPASLMLSPEATEEQIMELRVKLGIDKPYLAQLGTFLYNSFLHFDFGVSWTYSVPVMDELLNRLPYTLLIGVLSMVLSVSLGVILGIFAAIHQGKWQDSLAMVIAMIFVSCPPFWVALMMILLFSVKLNILPSYGIDTWTCYIMPIIACAIGSVAINARQTRSAMLEVKRADYITTARAKGQSEDVVIKKHMLPNALMPIITSVGGGFSRIVAGSTVIESVYSVPGVGLYLLTAINSRDYPVVRGCVLFFAVFTSLSMLLVDLIYAYVDPRIKAQYTSGKRV